MIYAFGGRNFYSFRDAFEVDFKVKPQASDREIFQADAHGQKCNAVMAVFGANASGKTHLLQVLGFIQWFVRNSAQLKPDGKILDEMYFKFQKETDLTTELFVEFGINDDYYRYEISFQPTHVVRESLHVRKTRFAVVFDRKWNGHGYDLKSQDFGENVTKIPQRKNASFISTALLMENPIARRIDVAFGACYGNLNVIGRSEQHDPDLKTLMETAEFFERNAEHLDWVNKRLKNFDLGLDGIAIHKTPFLKSDGKEEEKPFPVGVHRHQNIEYGMPLLRESRGTQALFILLRYILPVLKSGGVAFIDEFELGLHSHMIPCLVDLFYTRKYNAHGAQLIFSCHADYLLTQLEKYQLQLVDKDENGVSTTYRLDEIKGVRNVDNLYAKYHAGAYGGTPDF